MLQAQVDLVPVSVATVPHGASRCGDPAGAGVARGPARCDIGLMSSVACHSRLRPGRRGRVVSPAWRPRATLALAAFLVLLLTALPLASARAQSMPEALGGMDAVSLRDAGRPIGGDPAISTRWKGHEWRFANEANRATFEANPRAYAPGFGGNCPVALSQGERRPGRPELFVVIGNTLYLTSSPVARRKLSDDPADVLARAAAQWKRMRR